MYFLDHAFLRPRQLEGQGLLIELQEFLSDSGERPTLGFGAPIAGILQDGELQEEKFFKLQAAACSADSFCALAEMDVTDSLFVADELVSTDYVGRERFGELLNLVKGIRYNLIDEFR